MCVATRLSSCNLILSNTFQLQQASYNKHIFFIMQFFHRCANMVWSMKGFKGPPLSIICSFYQQKVSMALQKVQITIILHRAIVTTREAAFRLGVLQGFSPISLHDLLCAINDRFRSQVLCFLFLRLPIVHYALLGVVFCLDFGFFFFCCSFVGCFSFIYLFILNS